MNRLIPILALLFALEVETHAAVPVVDASTIHHKAMCGYQGWFTCPGDGSGLGWAPHWSKLTNRFLPQDIHVEYWPDLTGFDADEKFPVPGWTYPDGSQAYLFSSHNAKTVERHFEWMRDYGIDGAWLQRFAVGLRGGPSEKLFYKKTLEVQDDVRAAAAKTGRVWALSYDTAAMPLDQIADVLIRDWKDMVDTGVTADPRYLHEKGLPVVQIWGFYYHNPHDRMTPEVGNKLIDFFKAPGKYHAVLVGGGSWNWRTGTDPAWQAMLRRFDVYVPWNIGNGSRDSQGVLHATTNYWAADRAECEKDHIFWIPTVYAGISDNHLKGLPWKPSPFDRRKGDFLWEQFHALSKMGGIDTVYVAMFDEVDEGTAIFKVTNTPPTQAPFLTYDGLPSDWYLRLVGLGEKMLCDGTPVPEKIPIRPEQR